MAALFMPTQSLNKLDNLPPRHAPVPFIIFSVCSVKVMSMLSMSVHPHDTHDLRANVYAFCLRADNSVLPPDEQRCPKTHLPHTSFKNESTV
jgi:hypothetical protein